MRKFILYITCASCLTFSFRHVAAAKAQVTPVAHVSFGTLTDLRANAGTANVIAILSGLSSTTDGNGGNYIWNATSTTADDGFLTIAVSGVSTGRWIRIGNGNTVKGTATFSGVTLQTSYTVSYQGGSLPFVPAQVFIQPRSANAAALSYITNITTSGFTVNFLTVPVIGTNNIVFDYLVLKQ